MPFQDPLTNDRIVVVRKNDDLVAKKLVTFHSASDGTRVNFNMDEESDGSQRAVDLLPTFLDVSAPDSKKCMSSTRLIAVFILF